VKYLPLKFTDSNDVLEALKQLLVIERSPEPEDAIVVAHPTHEGTVLNLESLTVAQQAQIAQIILGFNAGVRLTSLCQVF
jgi:hypothetical protein